MAQLCNWEKGQCHLHGGTGMSEVVGLLNSWLEGGLSLLLMGVWEMRGDSRQTTLNN